jgi:hypothetical protein
MRQPNPDEVRRELTALRPQTNRLVDLNLNGPDERVELQAVLALLEDRAALARRCGFTDSYIAQLAGVAPELVVELLEPSTA